MAQGYLHVEIASAQSAKRRGNPCGDVFRFERGSLGTTIVCADGLGSGVKANIAAVMCVSRLFGLLGMDFSLREAFWAVARTMTAAMGSDLPFVAFTMARISPDGRATVLTYESPPPILVSRRRAQLLDQRLLELKPAAVAEAQCHLEDGEGLLLCSDGITQAGLGVRRGGAHVRKAGERFHQADSQRSDARSDLGFGAGWEISGVCDYVNELLAAGLASRDIPDEVHAQARRLWRPSSGDDCTVVLALCRPGVTVNLLTGPPARRTDDRTLVGRFLKSEGVKVVCGATTARLVGQRLGVSLQVDEGESGIAPPAYRLPGIDLVTEGAVTLNQVFNILDEDPQDCPEESGVTRLCRLLRNADRVNVFLGTARNPATGDIAFRQQGILPRTTIVPLLVERLRQQGKFVTLETF